MYGVISADVVEKGVHQGNLVSDRSEWNRWRLGASCCGFLLLLHKFLASAFERDGKTDACGVLGIVSSLFSVIKRRE